MNKRQIYQAIQDGTLEEKLSTRRNLNIFWWVILATIWICYSAYQNQRIAALKVEHSQCDSINKVDKLTIDMQRNALDSAVYFYEIKNR